MQKKNDIIDELFKKLQLELKFWTENLPHYSSMNTILEQYAVQYINRVNIINNIKIKGHGIKKEMLIYLLGLDNALDYLVKTQYLTLKTRKINKI